MAQDTHDPLQHPEVRLVNGRAYVAAFVVAVPITRLVAFFAARGRAVSTPERTAREKEPLG